MLFEQVILQFNKNNNNHNNVANSYQDYGVRTHYVLKELEMKDIFKYQAL